MEVDVVCGPIADFQPAASRPVINRSFTSTSNAGEPIRRLPLPLEFIYRLNEHPPVVSDFVFLDPSGKRWPRLRFALLIASSLVFVGGVLFVDALVVTPRLSLPDSVTSLAGQLKQLRRDDPEAQGAMKPDAFLEAYRQTRQGIARKAALQQALRQPPKAYESVRLGFYSGWDPNSADSLLANGNELTHVCPEMLSMTELDGSIDVDEDERLEDVAAAERLRIIPRLSNLEGDRWVPEAVESLVDGPSERRAVFVDRLVNVLKAQRASGVLVWWEDLDPGKRDGITSLLREIAQRLHAEKLELWLAVSAGDEINAFDLDALSLVVDRFVALLHDENAEKDAPGPIASQKWFEGWLQALTSIGSPRQWIVSVGSYGYDWDVSGGPPRIANDISFLDAMSRAHHAGLSGVSSGRISLEPHFSYSQQGRDHVVRFLDAMTFYNQARAALALNVGGIALMRMGMEDPHVWKAWDLAAQTHVDEAKIREMEPLLAEGRITNVGEGEFLTVDSTAVDGWRVIHRGEDGNLTGVYSRFPVYPTLYHQGDGTSEEVALSFDDGPDPKWTPQVLDILKAHHVKAAFFLLGEQAEANPELVRRIVQEGHEIGNHSYTHPNLSRVSRRQAELELNATQRLIEAITGRSTTLFRPPFNADSRPHDPKEIATIELAQEMGYLTVAENIDPEDWQRPSADEILRRIKRLRHEGSIILLHDAGGDRRETVKALPRIISYLRERGDEIVTLSRLVGIPRDVLMPAIDPSDRPVSRVAASVGFRMLHTLEELIWAFVIVSTVLVLGRTVLISVLALRHRNRRSNAEGAEFSPPITVIIAAYNEEKVVRQTLESVFRTDYRGALRVLVVDDGSTDGTADEVLAVSAQHPNLRLLRQSNTGKASALRRAIGEASDEILVMLDADTVFQPDTLRLLVAPLSDARVGAVSGNAKVGNVKGFLTVCQSLEYTCAFNLDRRAYHEWNCITVVPGAICAMRKAAIVEAGGIRSDTLAEDTDLTLSMHRMGYRIAYAADAVAWTEAPESIPSLARQRVRWAFGTIQCLWKHRDMLFNPRFRALGWLSLPSVWFFQIGLVALVPVADLLLAFSLLLGRGSLIYVWVLAFLAVDLFLAAIALWMDGRKVRDAWIMIPMRLLYRPLLSWVVWTALLRALRGAMVGWQKVERTASMNDRKKSLDFPLSGPNSAA